MNIREAIDKLVNRIDLSESDTVDVMNQIMTGEATPLQVASFLTALRMKGETVAEITGAIYYWNLGQGQMERIDASGSPIVVLLNKWELLDADARLDLTNQVSHRLKDLVQARAVDAAAPASDV